MWTKAGRSSSAFLCPTVLLAAPVRLEIMLTIGGMVGEAFYIAVELAAVSLKACSLYGKDTEQFVCCRPTSNRADKQ